MLKICFPLMSNFHFQCLNWMSLSKGQNLKTFGKSIVEKTQTKQSNLSTYCLSRSYLTKIKKTV